MKKISFLFSFILLVILTGCAHNTPNSNFNTPITLPIETIKSNGSVIHQPFSKDKIALLEKEYKSYKYLYRNPEELLSYVTKKDYFLSLANIMPIRIQAI